MNDNNNQSERIICTRCKVSLPIEQFTMKRSGLYQKRCNRCNENCRMNSKCEHNRQKNLCKECRGSSICDHNRQKNLCKECGGSCICEHNRRKNQCKDCMTDQEKIQYIQKTMITSSRQADKKKNRYDADNFIDKCFLEGLFEDTKNCYYCNQEFTYNECCDSFVTIERLNNSIGHIKSNCVLACFFCNIRHKSKDE